MNQLILFDGECHFCNQSINFIMKHDPEMHFHFAHLSSDIGIKLLYELNIPREINSLVLIQDNQYFIESTAALKISKKLNKGWPSLYLLIFIPKFLRDFIYRLVANNRYILFGKAKSCEIPSKKDRERFLL